MAAFFSLVHPDGLKLLPSMKLMLIATASPPKGLACERTKNAYILYLIYICVLTPDSLSVSFKIILSDYQLLTLFLEKSVVCIDIYCIFVSLK